MHLENPPVPVGPRIYRFTDFARNQEKIPLSLFTFNGISSTASAVYISKTHLCRLDPDFTILLLYYFFLVYYFTILTRHHLPLHASRKPTLACRTPNLHVGQRDPTDSDLPPLSLSMFLLPCEEGARPHVTWLVGAVAGLVGVVHLCRTVGLGRGMFCGEDLAPT